MSERRDYVTSNPVYECVAIGHNTDGVDEPLRRSHFKQEAARALSQCIAYV